MPREIEVTELNRRDWKLLIRKASAVFVNVTGKHDCGLLEVSKLSAIKFLEENFECGFSLRMNSHHEVFVDRQW